MSGTTIVSDKNQTLEQAQAIVAAFEANPVAPFAPDVPTIPTIPAPAAAVPPEKAALPTPVTPPVTEPAKPVQQPQATAEKVVSEPPKAAEPEKETDWKAAYQGLQRSTNKKFMEMKAELDAGTKPAESYAPLNLTPEVKAKITADLEKDLVGTLISLSREIVLGELKPIHSKLEVSDIERQQSAQLSGLDRLVKEGHEWIKTPEGVKKLESVLIDNPELWKTKDPYRAALGFISDIPSKAQQPSHAQTTGLTPILGAAGAMPLAVSTPAPSKVDTLNSMLVEVQLLQSRGQMTEAKVLLEKMNAIERGY